MRDTSEAGPASPTSTVGTKGGTSAVLLRLATISLLGFTLDLWNTLRPHGGRQLFSRDRGL